MMGFVCFTKLFGLHPEDCQGTVKGFETGIEPVCIFNTKFSLAAV